MLKLGDTNIVSAYIGDTAIVRGYIGDIDLGLSRPAFNLENPQARAYMDDVDYSGDTSYSQSYVTGYQLHPVEDLSQPFPARFQIPASANPTALLISPDGLFGADTWVYDVTGLTEYSVYNLVPGSRYYYRVQETEDGVTQVVKEGQFDTLGQVRMLHIDGEHVGNFRDIGGWPLGTGQRIRYGRLIRGAEVYRQDGRLNIEISAVGIAELKDRLGIVTEIDFGDFATYSPLEAAGFEFIHGASTYGFYAYDDASRGLRSALGRTLLSNSLKAVIARVGQDKPVYFHCNSGADRTGTFAFIVEALLGVSDSDKSKDYELTSFWGYYLAYLSSWAYATRRRNQPPSGGVYGYNTMVAYIMDTYDGVTLNEKVEDLCRKSLDNGGLALSASEISTLRTKLIESF